MYVCMYMYVTVHATRCDTVSVSMYLSDNLCQHTLNTQTQFTCLPCDVLVSVLCCLCGLATPGKQPDTCIHTLWSTSDPARTCRRTTHLLNQKLSWQLIKAKTTVAFFTRFSENLTNWGSSIDPPSICMITAVLLLTMMLLLLLLSLQPRAGTPVT